MSNQEGQQPTEPLWANTPGGTSTDTLPHEHTSSTPPTEPVPQWYGLPQIPAGPAAPSSTQNQGNHRPRNRRRIAELTAVASLAALLASGGTYAAAQLASQDTQPPSAASSSASLGRGSDSAPVVQGNPTAPDWAATAQTVSPSVVSTPRRRVPVRRKAPASSSTKSGMS